MGQEQVVNTDKPSFRAGSKAFVGRYGCQVQQVLSDVKVSVHFRKVMTPTKKDTIFAMMKKAGMKHISLDDVKRNMIVPVKILSQKRSVGRRLGWKPSHDIPRRREGFHHSVNRVIRESEPVLR